MNHYARTNTTVNAVEANASTIAQQLTIFIEKFSKNIVSINSSLDSMHGLFDKNIVSDLNPLKQKLHKYTRQINAEFKKPLLILQKQNIKLSEVINQRILPFTTSKEVDLGMADLKEKIDKTQQILHANNIKFESCFTAMKICQNKIGQLEQVIAKLELPDNVIKTTKQIKQAAQNMAILNAKVLEDNKAYARYDMEFRDLSDALTAFNLESNRIEMPTLSP